MSKKKKISRNASVKVKKKTKNKLKMAKLAKMSKMNKSSFRIPKKHSKGDRTIRKQKSKRNNTHLLMNKKFSKMSTLRDKLKEASPESKHTPINFV